MCIGGNGGHFENLLQQCLVYDTLIFFHLFKIGLEKIYKIEFLLKLGTVLFSKFERCDNVLGFEG